MMAGAGMLRTRRRDVSVKPNRKLDRKSSRGMIYENEELRLRTININAEVEQGQNDIKKLRRENEQLRREIWSLRDEYDKLEEILKRQKSRTESEEYEDRSEEDDELQSDYSFEEDEKAEEEDTGETCKDLTKSEQLENAENQKISSEKMTSSLHRLHVDFDDLSVVDEEEELKRDREKKDQSSEDVRQLKEEKGPLSILKSRQLHENIPFYPGTYQPPTDLTSPTYYTECPFKFPSTLNLMVPSDAPGMLGDQNMDQINDQILHAPPLGWQTNILMPQNQIPNFGTQNVDDALGMQGFGGNYQDTGFLNYPSFFQKRNTGLNQPGSAFNHPVFGNSQAVSDKMVTENGWGVEDSKDQGSDESKKQDAEEKASEKPKHFFAPLPSKIKKHTEESSPTTSNFGTGNSSSSGKTGSTVISKNQFAQKGSADIYVKGAVPCEEDLLKNRTEQRTYLSTDNLVINEDKSTTGNQLTKSMSCQDLSSESQIASISEGRQPLMTQSDNTLDNISDSKPYKSHLTVTLKTPRAQQAVSPDTPEIPQLPSIESRLFKNPFLRNFEPSRSYVDQNNVTRPLSVQVNDDSLCYYSPRPDVSTFKRGIHSGDRYRQVQTDPNRLLIPSNQLINEKLTSPSNKHQIQVTSFERPSPRTLVGSSSPYDYATLRRLNPSYLQKQNPYQNMNFLPRGGFYPQRGMMYYDTLTRKVPAQTQTSIDGDSHHEDEHALFREESAPSTPSGQRRRRTIRKEKFGVIKELKPMTPLLHRRLRKQSSVTSSEVPESPEKAVRKRMRKLSMTPTTASECQEDKNESRSSSSGQDSPKKDQTRRVSLYFNAKKRPSLTSVKTSRSGSVDVARDKDIVTNSERERTNSMSSRETSAKPRKTSTSSGNVPWCACWGNGCI
ncbi:uncharacterized protein LOC114880212 isoform X1 [Osmia bicornis bicornis]|uniref:uncharacterized protein LOC114880212 isoform X1 n=1 Tax=Osmia bicornis bicornis TaxID=1437191 RepID=UPI001EAF5B24|nr:uncharacterized protein LOC114880212 isoform X1 [Osmia bicornis bicornis]